MPRVEAVEFVGDERDPVTRVRLECGHALRMLRTPNEGDNVPCPGCINTPKPRRLPNPDLVLDYMVDEYVNIMNAMGYAVGDKSTAQGVAERAAMRRAAGIQYAWFCAATKAVDNIGRYDDGAGV